MKRNAIKGLLFALLLLCSTPLWAYDFSAENDDKVTIYYTITSAEDLTVEVAQQGTSYSGYSGDIVIPSTVEYDGNTYSVTGIGNSAFYSCAGITSIEIPSSVKSIGTNAFGSCISLTSVTFEDGSQLTKIGDSAFATCRSLTQITLPAESIGTSCFAQCTALTSVTLGKNMKTINENVFAYCSSLKEVISLNPEPPACANTYVASFYKDDLSGVWLVVPEGYASAYAESEDEWKGFGYLREITVSFNILTGEGYATHYSDYSYTLEDGLEAAIITGASGGNLTMDWRYGSTHDEKAVPEKTAVLIRKTATDSEVTELDSETSEYQYVNWTIAPETQTDTSSNMLYGSETAVTTYVPDEDPNNYLFYKLAYFYPEIVDEETGEGTGEYETTGTLGFYWGDTEGDSPTNCGGPFTNGAKLAWLAIPKETTDSSGDAKISFYPLEDDSDIEPDNNATDNETTGISAANTDLQVATKTIFNLQGVRVNDMSQKGIYIVDGRKVVKQ